MNSFCDKILTFCRKPLFFNSIIYTVTDGICKSLSFLLLPIVSYYIIPEELGVVANFEVLQSVLSLLAGQAIVNALPFFYYERDKQKIAKLVTGLIYIIVIFNIFFLILISLICPLIESYFHLVFSLQLLTILYTVIQLIHSINAILFRLEEKPYSFAFIQILEAILHIVLLYILVIRLKMGAIGKIYSAIGGYLLLFSLNIYQLSKRKYLYMKVGKAPIVELLKFGLPLLPHSLSFWIKSGMDKLLLTTYCGLSVNGLYSMAMSFGAIYTLCNSSFMMAYTPYLQKRISKINEENEQSEKKLFVRQIYSIFSVFILLFFIVVFFCWLIINFVLSENYKESFQFVPWIMGSLTLYSFYNLVIQFPYTVKKTAGLGLITFSGSIIQMFLTFVLIVWFGTDGVKYSLLLGSMIIVGGVWWYSNKVYSLPWFDINKNK